VADVAIAVHGGTAKRSPRREAEAGQVRAAMATAVAAGHDLLAAGRPALEAVEAVVVLLEDDGLFNAGRGSLLTDEGAIEMDASIADGETQRSGAVAAVRGVRNPVRAARAVLDDDEHALLVGEGAVRLARASGLELRPEWWFVTAEHQAGWLENAEAGLTADEGQLGTVGAVALDARGNLAAATSTGGRPGQRPGRVGDSALIGAGTWARNATAAVSCTGDGELIIAGALAHEVDALMRHRQLGLREACDQALTAGLGALGGSGGLIAVDAEANLAVAFNSELMSRGWKLGGGPIETAVGGNERNG